MADDEIRYATMTVKSIRGLEARTIAKWEADGWEVVSQSQGRLQTEITLRKPKKKTPRWMLIAGAAAVVVIVGALVIGSLLEDDDEMPAASASATPSTEASPASTPTASPDDEPPTTAPTQPSVPAADPAILTIENSPELAALLTGPADGESVAAFARTHAGDVIQFDGAIAAMNNHGEYATRYDILISFGNYSETETFGGPSFQLRDVGIVDLNLTGDVPDSIGVGDEVRVTAEVGVYEPDTTLFLLEPVETTIR